MFYASTLQSFSFHNIFLQSHEKPTEQVGSNCITEHPEQIIGSSRYYAGFSQGVIDEVRESIPSFKSKLDAGLTFLSVTKPKETVVDSS